MMSKAEIDRSLCPDRLIDWSLAILFVFTNNRKFYCQSVALFSLWLSSN